MSETKKIIRQEHAALSSLANRQIGVESGVDADLNFRMWGGKDGQGSIAKFLAKDKAARLTTIKLTGATTASGTAGILTHDADGAITGAADINLLANVEIISVSDNDYLVYDSTSGKWKNQALAIAMNYKGAWDADTNSPTLSNSGEGGVQGDFYIVSVVGSTSIDGETDWKIGDWIVNNGTQWDKIDNTEPLYTFNDIYDHESDTHLITVDDGDIIYYVNGAYSFNIDLASVGPNLDGFVVWKNTDGGDYFKILSNGDNSKLDLSIDMEDITIIAGNDFSISASGDLALITPLIADFTNATHDHSDAAGGGLIPPIFVDNAFFIQDDGDITKQLAFELSGITTGNVRTLTIPDASGSIVLEDNTATLTNKTFDANGTGNSLSNVDVADLADGTDGELITWDAAGTPAVVAVGTATHVLTSNGAGFAPTFQVLDTGANSSLSNLSSVAINTDLISDTADTDSLGSIDKEWLNLYIGSAGKIFLGLYRDTSIHRNAANELTLTASASVNVSANLAIVGSLTLAARTSLTDDGATFTILPAAGDYTRVGNAGTTSHSLASNDDLLVSGKLEVKGWTYHDASATFAANVKFNPDVQLQVGGSGGLNLLYSTDQTVNCVVAGMDINSNHMVFCQEADLGVDFGHAQSANPTIFLHSADEFNTADWLSLCHDQTDGVIDCGTGTLNLGGTANVNFAGATRTVSTVVHNAYVELEIAGTPYKFMLGEPA